MSITLTQLRSFLAVVRTGSVTAAADELFVTQPSVSAAVTGLSRELGTSVLEREGRGVAPTASGLAFAPYAADVIGLLENGRRAAHEAATLAEPGLRIAAVTTAAESFVPALMREFSIRHPQIVLTLSVGNRAEVLELVLDHRADVAFGGRPPEDERIDAHSFMPNAFVLIATADDPLVARSPVTPADLADRTWLLREPGSGTRTVNDEYLAATGLNVRTLMLGSNGAIKQAAKAGLGVSFISRDAVATELGAGMLGAIEVEPSPAVRHWHLLRSAVGAAAPAADAFVAFVRSDGAGSWGGD